ncbi:MAG TPA: S-layer protein domain-containing protein [Methanotrichaceae archaeon]|nr:S-layer protein domain-containing protein [Methanotrichaceae archaeon]
MFLLLTVYGIIPALADIHNTVGDNRCDSLATVRSAIDAAINTPHINGAPGSLLSERGSFKEHPPDSPCDPDVTYGPFEIASGGRLNASIVGTPPVPSKWSLGDWNSGMAIYYEPKYANGYGPGEEILKLSGQHEYNNLNGSAEWPGPGRLTVVISAPRGSGPLTAGSFTQDYSATVDIVSLNRENPAKAGTVVWAGDGIHTGPSGSVALPLTYDGASLSMGSNSDMYFKAFESGIYEGSELSTSSLVDKVQKRLDDLYNEGLPMPDEYYDRSSGFAKSFSRGTLEEAVNIIDGGRGPCEAAVELKLLFDSHKGELSTSKVEELFIPLGLTYGVSNGLSWAFGPYLGLVSGLLVHPAYRGGVLLLSRSFYDEYLDWIAGNQARVSFDIFSSSRGWNKKEFEDRMTEMRGEIESTSSMVNEAKIKLEKDKQDAFNNTLLSIEQKYNPRAPPSDPELIKEMYEEYKKTASQIETIYMPGKGLKKLFPEKDLVFSSIRDVPEMQKYDEYYKAKDRQFELDFKGPMEKLADLLIRENVLTVYRKPIVMGTCDQDLKKPKIPIRKRCPESAATIELKEGTVRYSNDKPHDRKKSSIFGLGGHTVWPKDTEMICEKHGDSCKVTVIRGNVSITNATRPEIVIGAGQQIDLESGKISPYNVSTDDGGPVDGIPLRDLPLDDASGLPYGLYMPNFRNNTIPASWLWQDPGSDARVETPEPGTLKVTVPDGNEFWDARTQAPRLLHKVTGDFDLEGELLLKSNGTDHAVSEFLMYSPGSYLGYLAKQMNPDGLGAHYRIIGGGWLHLQGMNKLLLMNEKLADGLNAPDQPVMFRLTRHGDVWKSYWSPDGVRWILSIRQEIVAPETVWVGWLFKRNAYDGLRSEPAITTLRDVSLETAPRGSMNDSDWDLVQGAGIVQADNATVRMELNGSSLGTLYAFKGDRLEGDFDAVVRFQAENWTFQPGESRSFGLSADSLDMKTQAFIGIQEKDNLPKRYMTALGINERFGGYQWTDTSDFDGYLRILRQKGNFSTYYWYECQWVRLDKFGAGFSDPVYIRMWISNKDQARVNARLSMDFTVEQILTGEAVGKNWTPAYCSILQPVPLPTGLKVPDGMQARMFQSPFALGTIFVGPDGEAYAFSSQKGKQKLLAIDSNGTAKTYIESELLASINRKSGTLQGEDVLVTVDSWSESGNRFSGIYELTKDGTYRKWNLTKDFGGLADIIPAPLGGWYISDYENREGIWHLPAEGVAETLLITQGDIPPGLCDLAYDESDGVLYALNVAGSYPFGGKFAAYKITEEGKAVLLAAINETSNLNGGMALCTGGSFGHALYVSDTAAGSILRVDEGSTSPVVTGLPRPGSMKFSPKGDLLVVCDGKYLLRVGGKVLDERQQDQRTGERPIATEVPASGEPVVVEKEAPGRSESAIIEGERSLSARAEEMRGQVATGDFTWTAQNFTGFYYDMDHDIGTETITTKVTDGNKLIGDEPYGIVYTTTAQDKVLEFEEWNIAVPVTGFLGKRYFHSSSEDGSGDELAEILRDEDEAMTIVTSSPLKLEQGYELAIKSIDVDGNKVYLELTKDGESVDYEVISPSTEGAALEDMTYRYETVASAPNRAPTLTILVHFKNAFRGSDQNIATVDGVYQISDTPQIIKKGDKFGGMTVKDISPERIVMANKGNTIALSRDKNIQLMGDIYFRVADDGSRRYYLYRDLHEPGTYDLRGSIATGDFEWNSQNFAGFYYDICDEAGTETLTTRVDEHNTLKSSVDGEDHGITYRTSAQRKDYRFKDWGEYDCMGLLGRKCFVGYDQLWEIQLDDESERTVTSSSSLRLAEGYELAIKSIDVDGNKVYLELTKDGEVVNSKVVSPSNDISQMPYSTYCYPEEPGQNAPYIIMAHFSSAFSSAGTNIATLDGVWQISGVPLSLKEGDELNKMKVLKIDHAPMSITMVNSEDIRLSRNKDLLLMEDIRLKTANSEMLRYCIYRPVTIRTPAEGEGSN